MSAAPTNAPVELRAPETQDLNFLLSSFLKSFRNSDESRQMSNEVFFDTYKPLWFQVLQNSLVVVASNPEDPSQIYGYAVYQSIGGVRVLHWVYVKFTFRHLGIAKRLFEHVDSDPATPTICTFISHVFEKKKKKYRLNYDPSFRTSISRSVLESSLEKRDPR